MGLFTKLVLFSDVEGVVRVDGKPVEGAEVFQEITFQESGVIPSRQVVTDQTGTFKFDAVTKSAGLNRIVPGQPTVLQKLLIKYQGVEYEGWRHNKDSYELNSELDGRPIKLVCELGDSPEFEGKHYGICRVVSKIGAE